MTQEGLRVKGKIDKLGRVVIPKRLREALQLQPGGNVELSVQDGQLHIVAEGPRYTMTRNERGRPVIHLADAALIGNDPVGETPDERMDRLMEW
ncbi:AbrB/MazE/SpoVT family DNA-binding domain-containing protein [Deinococcus lacus]|uniref:AbrB/MazE/SpoVT family DNA-binding domain-containing protein n=1 Tax=Deinococcus lacus TaxID=392561 RepID=A0ABW1YCQ2_9DEIO